MFNDLDLEVIGVVSFLGDRPQRHLCVALWSVSQITC